MPVMKAQTLATYLQNIQWAVRPAILVEDPRPLYAELPVEAGPITLKELSVAIRALRDKKVAGPDRCPLEFWRSVVERPGPDIDVAAEWLLLLFNETWVGKSVPEDWPIQHVVLLFKKGDPAECCNYRPICFLNAAYKVLRDAVIEKTVSSRSG